MLDYPYFIDLRADGLSRKHPITSNLPQLTMAWASPITVERRDGQQLTTLLNSSPESWLSQSMDIMPVTDSPEEDPNQPGRRSSELSSDRGGKRNTNKLGVMLQGRFDSYFSERPAQPQGSVSTALLSRSPESARIVLYSSNDFMDDQVLSAQVMASGTQYLGPVELLLNSLDWALQDGELLRIRSRAHFNRTLPPIEQQGQAIVEYLNYGLAVLWLVLLALVHWVRSKLRKRRYAARLEL